MALSAYGQEAYEAAMDALSVVPDADVDKTSTTGDNDPEQTDVVSGDPEQAQAEELDPEEGEQSEASTPGEPEERSGSDSQDESQAGVNNPELARLKEEKRALQAEFTRSRQELARLRAALDQERVMQAPQDPDQLAALEADAQRLGFSDAESLLASKRLMQLEMAAQNHTFALEQVAQWEQNQPNFAEISPRVQELAAGKTLFTTIPRTLPAYEQAALMRAELEPYYRIATLEREQKRTEARLKAESERKAKAESERKKAAARAASSEIAGKPGVRAPQGTPPNEDPGDAIVRQAGGWYARLMRS